MLLRLRDILEIQHATTTKRNTRNIKQNNHSITKQREVLQSKGKSYKEYEKSYKA